MQKIPHKFSKLRTLIIMNFLRGKSITTLKSLTRNIHGSSSPSTSPLLTKTPPPSLLSDPTQFAFAISGGVRSYSTTKKNSRGQDSYRIDPPFNFGIQIVPEKKAYVIERFGKFVQVLDPGIHSVIPFAYRVSYVHSMKEQVIPISNQAAITKDNVPIDIDGVLYVKIIDAELASYGVEDPIYAVVQLAQTVMRSELGKITLDKTFEERVLLNKNILDSINERPLRRDWGIECLRYEIKDITPPKGVKAAMEMQAEAERKKRARVLKSEGVRMSSINVAEGKKAAVIMASEAEKINQVNRAEGEAMAIIANAQATAEGLSDVSRAILGSGGPEATSLRMAEQYLDAYQKVLKVGTTMVIPENCSDVASMVVQGAAVYKNISKKLVYSNLISSLGI